MTVKSCEKVEKSQVALTIEVGAPEFEAAIEKAYQKMRKKINVPGFRPGKAPRKIIERMSRVMPTPDNLLPNGYSKRKMLACPHGACTYMVLPLPLPMAESAKTI